MTTVTATQLKNRIGEMLDDVQFRGERVILARKGKPAAAVISIEDLEFLEELEDRLDAAEADEAANDPDNQGRIPWEQIKRESRARP